jgi:UDP-N-acetylmuramate dehydrogenase
MTTRGLNAAARDALHHLMGAQVYFDEPMARHTHYRIGGPADALAEPGDTQQLKALLGWAAAHGVPYTVIGGGSNLLVRDGGIRGVAIRLTRLTTWTVGRREGRRVLLTADAGVPTRRLCALALRHGWQGLNFALGIPGSVGGAIAMNAGTAEGSMAEIIETVSVMTGEGHTWELKPEALDFGYRRLGLPERFCQDPARPPILLQAGLRLLAGNRDELRAQAREMVRARSRRQPVWQPSAGCFFRNPSPDRPAGRLIETAGLKGERVGGAQVSMLHANFIVNRGCATAADVLALAARIQTAVRAQFGIELKTEVRIVGDAGDA